ncbi:hypothetical protein [Parasitella parasitica]|uniref:Uncharacterized protein n=1 Tax=Parasitella parasitica TaxID=35722 RepID=A0A0B7NDS4_9FUNG|nr:hypothetical protein [Parasitella parasitica]
MEIGCGEAGRDAEEFDTKANQLVTFAGSGRFIRGHKRRSIKSLLQQYESKVGDSVVIADEYHSTITCNSRFQRNKKQVRRLSSGKYETINEAVVCYSSNCPRRKQKKATTTNRNAKEAKNILLIGFSMMISDRNSVLPLFNRNKTNK